MSSIGEDLLDKRTSISFNRVPIEHAWIMKSKCRVSTLVVHSLDFWDDSKDPGIAVAASHDSIHVHSSALPAFVHKVPHVPIGKDRDPLQSKTRYQNNIYVMAILP